MYSLPSGGLGHAMGESSLVLEQLVRFVNDPDFLQLDALRSRANFFKSVGRTYTETWHSMLLAWLLDPKGSHNLRKFPLKQFISMLSQSPEVIRPVYCQETEEYLLNPQELAIETLVDELDQAEVHPNERGEGEKVDGKSRFDVHVCWNSPNGKRILIIEQKIKAKKANDQEKRYPDYIKSKRTSDNMLQGCVVFLANIRKRETSSEKEVGDSRWYCINYQDLYDNVLSPCLDHPSFSSDMRPLLDHYVRSLGASGYKDSTGVIDEEVLAMSKAEREFAEKILRDHKDALKILIEVLENSEDEDDRTLSERANEQLKGDPVVLSVPLKNGTVIEGDTVKEFFRNILVHAESDDKLGLVDLPFSLDSKRKTRERTRYLINSEEIHPNGKPFFAPITYSTSRFGVWHIESHYGKKAALDIGKRLLLALKYDL